MRQIRLQYASQKDIYRDIKRSINKNRNSKKTVGFQAIPILLIAIDCYRYFYLLNFLKYKVY